MFLQLYDKNHHKIAGLAVAKAATVESVLSTGDGTLSFLYPLKEAAQLVNEAYVRTKTDEYIIKEVQPDSSDLWCSVKATLNVEDLEGICWPRFESVEQTIDDCLKLAIAGTGWAIGSCTVTKRRTIRKTECSGWDIIQQARKTYRCEIWFDTIEKKIHISEKRGQDKGMYFTDTLNLRKLAIQSTSYDFCTRIKAEGKDGLTFKEINGGKDYVENHQYSNKVLTKYWKDERYTNAQSLLEDTKAKLEELSKPVVAYSGDILDLAKASPKTYRILDFGLGDTVELVDSTTGTKEKQRIVKITEYPDEPERNTCEFANRTASFEELQQEQNEVNSTVNNITSDDGTISPSALDLDAITIHVQNIYAQELNAIKARIGDLEVTTLKATTLIANTAKIEQLFAEKATIQELTAAVGRIAILETGMAEINTAIIKLATIEQLNAANANIEKLLADNATINQALILKADIKDLQAVEARITTAEIEVAKIGTLSTDVANIKTLVNGNLTSANIQAGGITSDSLTIRDGFITNAMIGSVAAGKITAGKINTMLVEIGSENGNLSIKDNTIQIKEGTTIRVQIGKDANGEYSMYVWDKSGSLMFDAIQGLHAPGIKTGIIRDDMVADNANIAGTKIDIQSLVTTINGGITKIDSSIVQMDSAGQTLKVAFSTMTSTVNNVSGIANAAKTASETNTTAINVQKGRIDTLIQNTTITKDGQTVQLKDAYQKTVQTVEGIQTTIGNQQSTIDAATGDITSIKSQQATFNQNLQGLENSYTSLNQTVQQKADGTTVTAVTNRVGTLESGLNGLKSTVSSLQSTVSSKADSSTVTSLNTKVTTLESNLNGFKSTVSDTYVTKATFNDLEVGGRNIVENTEFKTKWNAYSSYVALTKTDEGNKIVWNTAVQSAMTEAVAIDMVNGEKYTFSAEIRGNINSLELFILRNPTPNLMFSRQVNALSETIFQKIEVTFIYVSNNAKASRIFIGGTASAVGQWIEVRKCSVKLEKGTMATDWTPAPEDFDASISAVDSKFTSYSTTSQMNSAIEQSKTGILSTVSNSYATKAQLNTVDGKFANYATTTAMNSAIDQKANQITQTVSTTYATKAQLNTVDGKFASYATTTAMNSAIDQKANQITQSVSTIYATKAQLNTVDGKFASYSTTTQMNSAIDQKANQITLSVSQTYTTKTEFSNLQIGIRNILRNSGGSSANTSYNTRNFATSNLKTNTKYTLVINGFTSVATQKIGVWFNNGSFHGGYFPVTTTAKTQYIVVTTPASLTTTQVNIYNYPSGSTRCTINWATMYEGDIRPPMDWTPAKEDTDASIELVENRTATLETNVNGITSRVTAVETKATTTANGLTNLTSRVSTAESKLTATSLITTFTTAINGGTKFTTTKFTMDNTGLTIKGGGIKIQNNAGANVLYGDTSGNLIFGGTLSQVSTSTNKTGIEIKNGRINMHAWQNGDVAAGSFIGYGGGSATGTNFSLPNNGQFGIVDKDGYYVFLANSGGVHTYKPLVVNGNDLRGAGGCDILAISNECQIIARNRTVRIGTDGELIITNSACSAWMNVKAANFLAQSIESVKTNILKIENAKNHVKYSSIYEYNLKNEIERGIYNKNYGFIIERETPNAVINTDGTSVNLYSMAAINWQATKEIILENDLRDAKIEHLQQETGELKNKIWQLEQRLSVA